MSARLIKIGVYCLRGEGHFDTYDQDEAGMCGEKGPDVFIAYDPEEWPLDYYPEWFQRLVIVPDEEKTT